MQHASHVWQQPLVHFHCQWLCWVASEFQISITCFETITITICRVFFHNHPTMKMCIVTILTRADKSIIFVWKRKKVRKKIPIGISGFHFQHMWMKGPTSTWHYFSDLDCLPANHVFVILNQFRPSDQIHIIRTFNFVF